jgi:hypothetical protein
MEMGRRVVGDLWLWLPKAPKAANCNGKQVKVLDKGEGIYTLHVRFNGRGKVEAIL